MRQRLGQNFLVDKNIIRKIVEAAALSAGDRVLEIGPGKGALTELLAAQARELIDVELDPPLARALEQRFGAGTNVKVENTNFLSYPFSALPAPLKIVANLPYNVSTAIIEKILPEHNWSCAVLMVQKEVGQRLAAHPGGREYGSFSILCQYYASIETVLKVPPGCFFPRPKVDSVVLRLTNKCRTILDDQFTAFLRRSFEQRRKTILNSLANIFGYPKEEAAAALRKAHINPQARPETLRYEDFLQIYSFLCR
jgi:16S rRNA (adenine1518-N6/adenine1519-N6)-dimethyltransferase